MKKTTILGILVGMFIGLQSQDIPIGAWRTHFAGRLAKTGALVKNEIFVGCQMGLYSYNLDTKTYKTYSKSDGISGYQLNKIVMDSTSGNLILTYADGNIDFYKNGSFTNIPDFFNYDFSGSKATNHINVSKGIAYISTNAGLLLININNMEVKETYSYIGPNASLVSVLSSAVKEDSLFISTNQGIMVGKLSPAVNLQNYNKWKMVPGSGTGGSIISFGGKIYTIINNQVHTVTATQVMPADPINADNADNPVKLQLANHKLLVVNPYNVKVYDAELKRIASVDNSFIEEVVYARGSYYIVTNNEGLVVNEEAKVSYYPTSPYLNYAARVKFFDGKVFVAPANMSAISIDFLTYTGLYIFDSYTWNNILPDQGNPNFFGVYATHVQNDTLYAATYNGVLKMPYPLLKGGVLYDNTNSNLSALTGNLYLFSDIAEDSKGNVFISQGLRKEGEYSFIKASPATGGAFSLYTQDKANGRLTRRIVIDDNDFKWLVPFQFLWDGTYFYGDGVTVYNDAYASKYRVLTTEPGKGKLTHNNVNTVCKTRNGEMWLGTDNGICIVDDPTKIFTNNYIPDARLPVYDSRALLRDKIVDVITVDAANRKWIATNGDGVWLFSANGDSLIQQFNTSNSPLPSNQIFDIGVNPVNGEVFFATDKGLVSYRADASEPNLVSDERMYAVKAFPNPVRPDFDGTIGLSGLGPNAIVKITDVSGKLVYETRANGGMATWNARDQNGNRVASGIYVVFSATADGEVGIVTKIAVIN